MTTANATYPTTAGVSLWTVVGDCSLGRISTGWDVLGTEDDAKALLARAQAAGFVGWENLGLINQGNVVDVKKLEAVAEELTETTGRTVRVNNTGATPVLVVDLPNGAAVGVDATVDAVMGAATTWRNMPDWGPMPSGEI